MNLFWWKCQCLYSSILWIFAFNSVSVIVSLIPLWRIYQNDNVLKILGIWSLSTSVMTLSCSLNFIIQFIVHNIWSIKLFRWASVHYSYVFEWWMHIDLKKFTTKYVLLHIRDQRTNQWHNHFHLLQFDYWKHEFCHIYILFKLISFSQMSWKICCDFNLFCTSIYPQVRSRSSN